MVVTAYNEGDAIVPHLDRIFEAVTLPCEVLVVFDSPDDTTAEWVEKYAKNEPRLRPTLNTYGRGPARAIRFGIDAAQADVVVVTMADGCDDPQQIDQLTRLVERGVVVAAASRYMRAGQQVGGPAFKTALSRWAGRSLYTLARVGTHDATNSFKAYQAAASCKRSVSTATTASKSASSWWPRPAVCVSPSLSCPRSGSTARLA